MRPSGPVGVLALQGAFAAHASMLRSVGFRVRLVRSRTDFTGLAGLVLPGGESTVQLALLERLALDEPLGALLASGLPVLATCAGLILAAREVTPTARGRQRSFAAVDVSVTRNGFGPQTESFEATSDDGTPLVFIRAPRITSVGARATVHERYRGEPVLVQTGAVWGATYHPELSGDASLHRHIFRASAERMRDAAT